MLEEIILPTTITVHLGRPTASAQNVTIGFVDYIKNVASSEMCIRDRDCTFTVPCFRDLTKKKQPRHFHQVPAAKLKLFEFPTHAHKVFLLHSQLTQSDFCLLYTSRCV